MIKLDRRKCADLKPYENNARINDKAIDAVANSIRDFGMNNPILIDENNVVVAGHARLKALEKLHIEETPVLVLSDLSEDKIKAFRIADNSTAQLAEWDLQKLQAELDSFDIEMEQYGLQEQLDKIQQQIDADMAADLEEDEVPEPDEINQPITEEGDIWKLGRHFLMCGDCTKEEHVKKLLNETKIDLFVTDPPYNVDYEGKTKEALTISNDDMDEEEYLSFLKSAFSNADAYMKSGAAFYIWHADSHGLTVRLASEEVLGKIRKCLVWIKSTFVLGMQDYQWKHEPCLYGWKDGAAHFFIDDRKQSTVMEYDKPQKNEEHPTIKPLGLIKQLIINSSKPNQTVYDAFCGSGTTLIACEKLNRTCYAMELKPKFCDVIIKRWETATGLKAVKVKG